MLLALLFAFAPSFQGAALRWEILDPREVRYVLARREDLAGDLSLLRRRLLDLYDAPPLADGERLPSRDQVAEALAQNRLYRQHVTARQEVDLWHQDEIAEALRETERLYEVWDNVRDSRCDYYYVTVRRQALQKLRTAIGDESYYSGRLPPPIPLWRLSRP